MYGLRPRFVRFVESSKTLPISGPYTIAVLKKYGPRHNTVSVFWGRDFRNVFDTMDMLEEILMSNY